MKREQLEPLTVHALLDEQNYKKPQPPISIYIPKVAPPDDSSDAKEVNGLSVIVGVICALAGCMVLGMAIWQWVWRP